MAQAYKVPDRCKPPRLQCPMEAHLRIRMQTMLITTVAVNATTRAGAGDATVSRLKPQLPFPMQRASCKSRVGGDVSPSCNA